MDRFFMTWLSAFSLGFEQQKHVEFHHDKISVKFEKVKGVTWNAVYTYVYVSRKCEVSHVYIEKYFCREGM